MSLKIAFDPNFLRKHFSLPIAVGHAISSYTYSWDGKTIYIRNFFVEILFNGLLRHAKEVECNRIEFDVLNSNTGARKFYENFGAINMTDEHEFLLYRVCKDVIDRAAAI